MITPSPRQLGPVAATVTITTIIPQHDALYESPQPIQCHCLFNEKKMDCCSLPVPGFCQINSEGCWRFLVICRLNPGTNQPGSASPTSKLDLEIVSGMVRYYESLFWEGPIGTHGDMVLYPAHFRR